MNLPGITTGQRESPFGMSYQEVPYSSLDAPIRPSASEVPIVSADSVSQWSPRLEVSRNSLVSMVGVDKHDGGISAVPVASSSGSSHSKRRNIILELKGSDMIEKLCMHLIEGSKAAVLNDLSAIVFGPFKRLVGGPRIDRVNMLERSPASFRHCERGAPVPNPYLDNYRAIRKVANTLAEIFKLLVGSPTMNLLNKAVYRRRGQKAAETTRKSFNCGHVLFAFSRGEQYE